ncbi:40S ribosomal protein S30, putative [Leishmania tarentolae]|uniref:40S ribosomal protein S30, putative n=1 Tax=Leishmania tarentolae TaxID=5689 RepID=A0A640KSY5_LEITA|nr:40S ribosomal protein S30, putative [Leishmania tarentolae]
MCTFSPGFTVFDRKRLVYFRRFSARPRGCFRFSCLATLGVWFLTLPARAREPWILPMMRMSNCRIF